MEQQNSNTSIGRERTSLIEEGKNLIRQNDLNTYPMLRRVNLSYYDTLDGNTEAQDQLKQKWDPLSVFHQKQIKSLETKAKGMDSYDAEDFEVQKQIKHYEYEYNRFIEAYHNYMHFHTYWDL